MQKGGDDLRPLHPDIKLQFVESRLIFDQLYLLIFHILTSVFVQPGLQGDSNKVNIKLHFVGTKADSIAVSVFLFFG